FLIIPELYGIINGTEGQFFDIPTPGRQNSAGFLEMIEDIQFSAERGFFDAPFDLTLNTNTVGASIYYTTDGTMPSETNGTPYTEPIPITTTTTFRAVAIKESYLSTDVDTHTYVFLDHVLTQTGAGFPTTWGNYVTGAMVGQSVPADYEMDQEVVTDPRYEGRLKDDLLAIPTISLVADSRDLFDLVDGIYVNSWMTGRAWERPVSVEMFDGNGQTMFQVNAGLRIHGGASRYPSWSAKHNFRLLFKREYGPTKLKYPLFGEDATDEFDTLILRLPGVGDTWSGPIWGSNWVSYLNDQWVIDTQRDLGSLASHTSWAHLYVNGLYWGLYRPIERPNAAFAASYL
ncbi:hypothetical protein LCGC14_3107860, partial [marine sediment metagenome]